MQYRHEMLSPLGKLQLFARDACLTGLYFPGHKPEPKQSGGSVDHGPFHSTIEQLEEYFAGQRNDFELQVRFEGTEFQVDVWNALRLIPVGETQSYSQLADRIGRPSAVRAVGAAVGRNPISIIIPCHRVIGANGKMTGFAGGIDRKRWLLDRERNVLETA